MNLASIALAQNPIDSIAGSLQEQMNTAGQQLQEKAAKHIVEGNLTQEHIVKDLDATKKNLTEQAKNQLDKNLNITPEQIREKAAEELKNQVNQKIATAARISGSFGRIGHTGSSLLNAKKKLKTSAAILWSQAIPAWDKFIY